MKKTPSLEEKIIADQQLHEAREKARLSPMSIKKAKRETLQVIRKLEATITALNNRGNLAQHDYLLFTKSAVLMTTEILKEITGPQRKIRVVSKRHRVVSS